MSDIMFPNQKETFTGLGLGFFGHQGQLPPVPTAGEHLPPPVQGGDPRREHDVEFFEKAKSTLAAGRVVACQSLLQQVPCDGEAGAGLPQLVHVPAEGGSGLLLVLLLHVVVMPVMSLSEGPSR